MPGPVARTRAHDPVVPTLETQKPPDPAGARASHTGRPAVLEDGVDARPRLRKSTVDVAAAVLARHGLHGFGQWLSARPKALVALAQYPDGDLRDALAKGLAREQGDDGIFAGFRTWLPAMSAAGKVKLLLTARVRQRMHRLAVARVDQVRALVARQDAARGADTSRALGDLRLPGHLSDSAIDEPHGHLYAQLGKFRAHLDGSTWDPVDFPVTRAQVMAELGLVRPKAGSIASEVLGRPRADDMALAGTFTTAGDVVLAGTELLGAEFTVAAVATALAPLAASLAVGYLIDRAIDDNREARREVARRLGL